MTKARIRIKTNSIYKKYANFGGRYLFYFGGAGSGKSIDAIQRQLVKVITQNDAKHKILFIRKVGATIQDSIWAASKQILSEWGLYSLCRFNKIEKSIIFEPNGNEIIMKGLDDPEKIKSIAGITGILIEEVTELTLNDFLQLDLRLRGETKYPKQIVCMFNPIEDSHWLWQLVEPQLKGAANMPENIKNVRYLQPEVWEFDKVTFDGGLLKTRVINTNYKHNKFLDSEYISQLKMLSSISENYSQVYEFGRWGRVDVGNLFVHQFSEVRHVGEVEREKNLPIHYTVDFNVSPYMSGLVVQMEYIKDGYWNGFSDYWEVSVIDEIANEHPKNTAYDLGKTLQDRYDLTKGFFLYGDASGNKRLGVKDTKTHFHDLKKPLTIKPVERIPTSNPKYKAIAANSLGRQAFLNVLFSGKKPVKIKIDPKCENFIKDLKLCTQDANGRLEKKKNKNGIEERGHHLDAFQYFICHPQTLGYLAKMNK